MRENSEFRDFPSGRIDGRGGVAPPVPEDCFFV